MSSPGDLRAASGTARPTLMSSSTTTTTLASNNINCNNSNTTNSNNNISSSSSNNNNNNNNNNININNNNYNYNSMNSGSSAAAAAANNRRPGSGSPGAGNMIMMTDLDCAAGAVALNSTKNSKQSGGDDLTAASLLLGSPDSVEFIDGTGEPPLGAEPGQEDELALDKNRRIAALLGVTRREPNSIVALKLVAIFSTLYFFMWSSSILSQAFNLASYHYAGNFIRTSGFLQNPLIGLMVGVITTVIFQSSGAVTSVLVTIVGSGVLNVRQSIPIIMGANLGTSVTNTVVSLIVYRKKQNFEIAMTAGIVHDMYNMMSVVFMLPIELLFHPLEYSSKWMLNLLGTNTHTEIGQVQFLSHLVKPLVDLVIMIDKDKTADLDPNVIIPSDVTLVKRCCNMERRGNETFCHELCPSLFSHLDLSDNVVCVLLLVMAMFTLFTCLIFVVKVTKSLLGGKLLNWVANLARREYKFPYSMFVGYLFILVGLVITVILHSSGVFTSMLVPLAGGDVLNLMQIYELTLGSNVGTTTTGIFAALSAQSKYPVETLQVALCHFIFNVAGILMFYSIPHTTLPIWASKKFGMYSAQNMWFSIIYLVIVFLVAPSLTMAIYLMTSS